MHPTNRSTAKHGGACVVGPRITVRGTLSGEEDLTVEGCIEGGVSLAGHLLVAAGGVVKAQVDVDSAAIHGEVEGDVVAGESIAIERGAVVRGNVRAPRVVVADGAHVDGAFEMDVELPEGLLRHAGR